VGQGHQKATGTAYAPEALEVSAWVKGPADPAAVPGSRSLEKLGPDSRLVSIARYEDFKGAVAALSAKGLRFIEIAGNPHHRPDRDRPGRLGRGPAFGDTVAEWPLLTAPGKKRVAFRRPRLAPARRAHGPQGRRG